MQDHGAKSWDEGLSSVPSLPTSPAPTGQDHHKHVLINSSLRTNVWSSIDILGTENFQVPAFMELMVWSRRQLANA